MGKIKSNPPPCHYCVLIVTTSPNILEFSGKDLTRYRAISATCHEVIRPLAV